MQPCRYHLTASGCRKGELCNFPHLDPSKPSNAGPSQQDAGSAGGKPPSPHIANNENYQRFYQWRRMIPREPHDPSASFSRRLARFFQLGLTLVEGDLSVLQETIKELASEGGLLSIRELIELHIPSCRSDAHRLELWRSCVRPLFTMMAEARVTRSTLLEVHAGAIYNAILGYNASRLQPMCDFLLSISDNWRVPIVNDSDGLKSAFLELCTSTLSKIVDCNTQALVNDAIPPIVERFKSSLDSLKSDSLDFWILQTDKNIEYIRRRLSIIKGVSQSRPVAAHSLSRATFVLRRDLPGELSADGPRHDNDYADCTKIRILPTMSEIMAKRQDYRPFLDSSQLHLPGVQGLIDRHFRLLRDDMVGQLKESISYELDRLNSPQDQSIEKRGVRTHSYKISAIVDVTCNRQHGLEFHLEIEQPFRPNPKSAMDCEEWWALSRRLEPGALVCVLQRATAIFCVVSESTIRPDPNRPKTRKWDEGRKASTKRDLYSHEDFSYVKLSLAEPRKQDVQTMIRSYKSGLSNQRVLVEFPGVLLPSFQSTLGALQQIYKTADLPFVEILTHDEKGGDVTIPPPIYATKAGFTFNLKSITNKGEDLLHSLQALLDPDVLVSKSQLDHGQAVACLNALRRSFQLIQGPPGTGKSWTGEAKHLWHRGITQIIRIGSRSKSTLLENVTLKKVAKEIERTKAEKKEAYTHGTKLTNIGKEIKSCLDQMETATSATAIKEYLVECGNSAFCDAIFGAEAEEGWTKVTHTDENGSLNAWVSAGANVQDLPRSTDVLKTQSPNSLSRQERQVLFHHWARELMNEHVEEFVSLEADYRKTKSDLEAVLREIDLRVLSQCQIIGVTTTGLAKNLDMLRKVNSKVLLCEEAGEVLESHILTALLPSLEHVILIGDHLQLRPQIANYELSINNPSGESYSLDVSLFERLVKPIHLFQPKLAFDTLTVQRRMHPSISRLIRETIYSNLEDASHLSDYPEVVGMRKRLFWFDHTKPESKSDPTQPLSTTHTNDFEVDMVSAMVSHLVRQGVYARNQIAVLTPYLGQLHKLKQRLRNSFEIVLGDRDTDELDKQGLDVGTDTLPEVRKKSLGKCLTLATVDNFQGEEADVIVISLVRSNPDGRCGFLKTSNRINVLLSRAKHGMYIFGNAATYSRVQMWSKIIGILKSEGNFGTKLPLRCPRHEDKIIEVGSLDDFGRLSPEAGCDVQCLRPLSCGHTCTSPCHSTVLHKVVKCLGSCLRSRPFCDHPCPNACGDPCEEECSTILTGQKVVLSCGHTMISPQCWQAREPTSITCMVVTEKIVPSCGHKVKVPCHEEVSKDLYKCKAQCGYSLPCGHLCSQSCGTCKTLVDGKVTIENHPPCNSPCQRDYSTCAHLCSRRCHPGEECSPCDKPCEIQCEHSRCGKKCSEPCAPCTMETCCSACPHSQCTMPCAAPCNWSPCSMRCAQRLACGPSLCGEICPEPDYCQTCASAEIRAMVVDVSGMEYHEIDLDIEPCIFPDCMHVLTVTSMDILLGMSDHYKMAVNGCINGIQEPANLTRLKSCPTCRGSLRNISRYGRLVRQCLLEESTKKFITWSYDETVGFEKRLLDQQERLDSLEIAKDLLVTIGRPGRLIIAGERLQQMRAIVEWVGYGRYDPVIRLYYEIAQYVHLVAVEEQPYEHMNDLVALAQRREAGIGQFLTNTSKLETRGLLLAGSLLLRCDLLILRDFLALCLKATKLTIITLDLTTTLDDCNELVRIAREKKYLCHEAEGHIYFTQFVALAQLLYLEQQSPTAEETENMNWLKARGDEHLAEARDLLSRYKGAAYLFEELETTEFMLNNHRYAPVGVEKRSVWLAMSRDLRGTGHLYTCQNGHPFTVGECGMPMEEARCHECGAAVDGIYH
ncbi:hypothetical protein F4680DRAFT_455897 [Xylaria scruposa]|nr:hypothetical protein F4680DRAFT_455897 [Xylaria scruposa]